MSLFADCASPDTFASPQLGTLVAFADVAPVAAPSAPAPPSLTPCPAGWTERDGGSVACEPWPGDVPPTCGADSAHFPGEATCRRIGTACPADGWPDALPAGRAVLFVSASATTSGDGQRATPFATLAEATTVADAGTVIALSTGMHLVDAPLAAQTLLLGACPAGTTVARRPTSASNLGLQVTGPGVEIRNLSVTGTSVGVIVDGADAGLALSDVIIDGATGYGLAVKGQGHATAEHVVVRNTLTVPGGGGTALLAIAGASLEVSGAVLEGNVAAAALASGAGSSLRLSDADVAATQADATSHMGYGALAQDQAAIDLQRVVARGNHTEGIVASTGATITAADVVVLDTAQEPAGGAYGAGLAAVQGTVTASRVRLERNHFAGALADQKGVLTLTDVLVADTHVDRATNEASALFALHGATATVTRGVFLRSGATGVGVVGTGSLATLTDVEVDDSQVAPKTPGTLDKDGAGLRADQTGLLRLSRVRLSGNHSAGIEVTGGQVDGSDVIITTTLLGQQGLSAGMVVERGGTATLTRALVEDGTGDGIDAFDHSQVTLSDVAVSSMALNGIGIGFGGQLQGQRIAVIGSHGAGIIATLTGSSGTLSDVSVEGTVAVSCTDGTTTCAGSTPMSVVAANQAALRLERFRLFNDNLGLGVVQAFGAQLDLAHGDIAFHAIGADVFDGDFDVSRLNDDVSYRFDGQKLISMMVPLPAL
jgi:hypothetical protein